MVSCLWYLFYEEECILFEAYEELFSLRQDNKSLEDNYNYFKGMIDELNQYDPVTNDIEDLKKCEDIYVYKFLSRLSLHLNYSEDSYRYVKAGFPLYKILCHDRLRLGLRIFYIFWSISY